MNLTAFFQLIRWKNVLIIFSTQILIKFILIPKFDTESTLSNQTFFLVAISILCITAAGYILNDIIDVKIDLINKGNKTIINNSFPKDIAKKLYYILTLIGVSIGVYVCVVLKLPELSIYFILISMLLYAYSKKLKSVPLIGNLTVAFLVSSSIFIIAFFEQFSYNSLVFKIIIIYSIFAFSINLIREIIKDIEDIDGDFAGKLKTLPITVGRKRTNAFIIILSSLLAISIITLLFLNKEFNGFLFYYGISFVLTPLLYFISKLTNTKSKEDYKKRSALLKIIMVLGILSIFTL